MTTPNITAYKPSSSDLTNYEACEILDDNKQKTGAYNLVRKTLEAGLPFRQSCEHAHKNAGEASACDFFSKELRSKEPRIL